MRKWSVAHSPQPRVLQFVTSNGAEGFNGTHASARQLPLMHATVEIFVWSLMHYLELRVAVLGEQALTDGQGHVDTAQTASADDRARLVAHERLFKDDIRPFFGFYGEQFVEWKQKFGAYKAQGVSSVTHQFLVRRNERSAQVYTVDARARSCSCGARQVGMPCGHVYAVLRKIGANGIDAEMGRWGAFGTHRMAVQMAFRKRLDVPAIDWRSLGKSDVVPPSQGVRSALDAARSAKRKRKRRTNQADRLPSRGEQRRMTCSNCGEEGHNRRGCTKPAKAAAGAAETPGADT